MIERSTWAGLLLLVLTGCPQTISTYSCDNPDKGHKGPDGEPDPCHYQDVDGGADGGEDSGAQAEPRCVVGEFTHWTLRWEPPTLLWVGPEDQAPECPLGPATISYEGHADLVAPSLCEACTCEPPTGSCALPSTLTASKSVCGTPGAPTSFNAPMPWDGHCDSTTQVPQGAAYSLTIGPMTMTENGCASGPPVAAKVISLHWNTFARGCDVGLPPGPTERSVCLSADLIEPGFKACIFRDGEHDCPNDEPGNVFTERHVFYQGVQDDRQCSTCTCGAPKGSACTAMLSIYKGVDLTCGSQALAQNTISSVGPICIDIALPGQALGSKSAGPTTYLPGVCLAMGGDGSGSATETEPSTLCCHP